jgi:Suppressor of fused protein (SUFU)
MIDIREVIRKHYVGRWAEPSRCAEFRRDSRTVEVYKWDPQQTDEGLVLYATLGGSERPVGPLSPEHRVELFTRLLPEEDNIARYLSMLLLSSAPENPHLLDGHTINYQEPIWEGTEVSGFLILEPRVELIPQLQIGGFHIDFLQVIPLFPSELIFKAKYGVEELLALWEKDEVPFWSMRRNPVRSTAT